MDFVITLLVYTNLFVNKLGEFLLSPIALLPGWVSITIISAFLGIVLLFIFKYTSNQKQIASIRDSIKADMLAIRIFKNSTFVIFKAQTRVFFASFKLLFHSIVPMLVMIVPVSLTLAQMGLWYQARPVRLTDDSVIVKLSLNQNTVEWPKVKLRCRPAAVKTVGPVKVWSKKEIYWKIKPVKNGYFPLVFEVGEQKIEKQLAIGDGFMRLSSKRPGPVLGDVILYPLEKPFQADAAVQSVTIDYPARNSKINGTDWWIFYFFIVSLVFALIFKPFLRVRI
ncbi:MAG: hypothetical protein JRI61_00495 [Deltaproteobacteria bacterium]|nr:hypothetical protein [Deltaproteobacteria bacterium]